MSNKFDVECPHCHKTYKCEIGQRLCPHCNKSRETEPLDQKTTPHDQVILAVNWALQEAYKIAVHQAGITNWSEEKPERKHEIEVYQVSIAGLILDELRGQLKG